MIWVRGWAVPFLEKAWGRILLVMYRWQSLLWLAWLQMANYKTNSVKSTGLSKLIRKTVFQETLERHFRVFIHGSHRCH